MDPQTLVLIVSVLVVVALAIIYFQIKKLLDSKSSDETTKLLTQLVSDMRGSMDKTTDSMVRQTKAINERLDRAAQVISGVSKSVGEMTELGRSMRDLQEFLRSPKLRGQIGEAVLKDLLGQILPKQNFHLQYAFKGGEVVDAALKLEQGIIPIDAKFPMENFRKMAKANDEKEKNEHRKAFIADVKKHIDAIANKYIRPAEGTLDFALMYIPAIIMSLEGSKIEKQAGQILAALREIGDETNKFGDSLSVLTRHVKNAAASSDDVNVRFSRLSSKISTVQSIEEKETKKLKTRGE